MTYWETAGEQESLPDYELEFARIWKDTPKIVFSRTLERVEGSNTTLVQDDAVEEVSRLKEQPGKHLAVGGAGLAVHLHQGRPRRRLPAVRQPGRPGRRHAVLSSPGRENRPGARRDTDVRLSRRLPSLPASTVMSQRNVDIARAFIEAYNRRDFDAAVESFDPHIEWVLPERQSFGLMQRSGRDQAFLGGTRRDVRRVAGCDRRSSSMPVTAWRRGCATTDEAS